MKFNICNKLSGIDFGNYDGVNELAALDAMARDAGYRDYAEACEVAPANKEIIVTVLSDEQSIAFKAGAQAHKNGEKLQNSALRNLHPESKQYHDFIAGYDSVK